MPVADLDGSSRRWPDVTGDPRFVQFLVHFNGDRDYFECHELMEEIWLEEGRHALGLELASLRADLARSLEMLTQNPQNDAFEPFLLQPVKC